MLKCETPIGLVQEHGNVQFVQLQLNELKCLDELMRVLSQNVKKNLTLQKYPTASEMACHFIRIVTFYSIGPIGRPRWLAQMGSITGRLSIQKILPFKKPFDSEKGCQFKKRLPLCKEVTLWTTELTLTVDGRQQPNERLKTADRPNEREAIDLSLPPRRRMIFLEMWARCRVVILSTQIALSPSRSSFIY